MTVKVWPNTGEPFYRPAQSALERSASPAEFADELIALWSHRYRPGADLSAGLVTFTQNGAEYLFDKDNNGGQPRTVAAMGFPERPSAPRDTSYQAGYPMPTFPGRPADRGHMFPNSAGGEFGPNIYRQDRALNRGLSQEGRQYRRTETAAIASDAFFFCALVYCDRSDFPALVELGLVTQNRLQVSVFRNRFDAAAMAAYPPLAHPEDSLHDLLATLTTGQIGDIGEETARAWLEDEHGAPVITVGDSSMERTGRRQDLDMTVLLDGEFVAVEVKTRYFAAAAGRLTHAGNLPRPRLRSNASAAGPPERQGTPGYASARLRRVLDRPDDGLPRTIVVAVDLRALYIQRFDVSERGTLLPPTQRAEDCTPYVIRGVEAIVQHRGTLN